MDSKFMESRFHEREITEEIQTTLIQFNIPDVIINIIENYNVPLHYFFKQSWCDKFLVPIKRYNFCNKPIQLYVYMIKTASFYTITTIAVDVMQIIVVSIIFKCLIGVYILYDSVALGEHIRDLHEHPLYRKATVYVFVECNYGGDTYIQYMQKSLEVGNSLCTAVKIYALKEEEKLVALYDIQRLFIDGLFIFAALFIGVEDCYIHDGITIKKELTQLKFTEIRNKADSFKDQTLYCLAYTMYYLKNEQEKNRSRESKSPMITATP